MWPVSTKFLDYIRGPHQMTARIEVWVAGVQVNPALAYTDGEVTFDAERDVRGSLSATLQLFDRDLATDPLTEDRPLDIYGQELRPFRGVRYPDGTEEEVPLGRYIVDGFDYATRQTEVRVNATDHSLFVSDDRFLSPRNPTSAPMAKDYIQTLITETLPTATFTTADWDTAPTTTVPDSTVWDEDRWKACRELALSLGRDLYPGRDGVWRLAEIGDPNNLAIPVAWTVDTGPMGVLLQAQSSESREPIYNAVVARGESNGETPPVQAVAYHTDSESPARWGGPFGKKPRFYASPLLLDVDMCQKAADTLLARYLGVDRKLGLSTVPNPALDPGDVIDLVGERGTHDRYLVTSLGIPLQPDGTFTATARTQQPKD